MALGISFSIDSIAKLFSLSCEIVYRKQGCGSGSAKILLLPLPHWLFDLNSNLAKKFCSFPNVD